MHLMMVSLLLGQWRELQNGLIGVDVGHVVGIPTPAQVEAIGKRVDLEAEYMPNGWRRSNACVWWSRFDHWATRREDKVVRSPNSDYINTLGTILG